MPLYLDSRATWAPTQKSAQVPSAAVFCLYIRCRLDIVVKYPAVGRGRFAPNRLRGIVLRRAGHGGCGLPRCRQEIIVALGIRLGSGLRLGCLRYGRLSDGRIICTSGKAGSGIGCRRAGNILGWADIWIIDWRINYHGGCRGIIKWLRTGIRGRDTLFSVWDSPGKKRRGNAIRRLRRLGIRH